MTSPQGSASGPGRRVLVCDPAGDYSDVGVVVASLDELAVYLDQAPGVWKIVYQSDDLDATFPALCMIAYELGRVLFIVDEADWWCSPHGIVPDFATVIKYGRKRGVTVMGIARRPSEVHRLLTSQSWMIYCFGTPEALDLDYLRRNVSQDFPQDVAALDPFVCKSWDRRRREARYWRVDQTGPPIPLAGIPKPG